MIIVRHDPESGEETTITWDRSRNALVCSMAQSSEAIGTSRDVYTIALHHSAIEGLKIDVYVDCSLIEVYAGPYTVCSLRVYPKAVADRIGFEAHGAVTVSEFLVHEMGLSHL
jgi:sucrose-6-phosphate hydrolase SacC (GH32 family)